jgi:hypothetical protein
MKGVVVIDTNLLLLLIVGLASPHYILKHKRVEPHFTPDDFEMLGLKIAEFSDIVTLRHILAETSSLIRQHGNPELGHILSTFRCFIERTVEIPATSLNAARGEEFESLGLTDAVIVQFCGLEIDGTKPTRLTTDTRLADRAKSLGQNVFDYRLEYQAS